MLLSRKDIMRNTRVLWGFFKKKPLPVIQRYFLIMKWQLGGLPLFFNVVHVQETLRKVFVSVWIYIYRYIDRDVWKEMKYLNHNICFYCLSSDFLSDKATRLPLLGLQTNTGWTNELLAILLNQLSGWLVWLFCAEASGRNNTTWFFRSRHPFSAGIWGKDICCTTKLCVLKVSSLKIGEEGKQYILQSWNLEIKGA